MLKQSSASLLVFFFAAASVVFSGVEAEETIQLFDPAPPLEVQFVKGKPVTIAEGRGEKVYIVEFWATWCAPCKRSIPHLTALQQRFGDDGLVIVGISDEKLNTVQRYVATMGDKMEYRVAIDKSLSTNKRYTKPFKTPGIPWAFVIDKAGRIMWNGHPMDAILPDLIEALLEEEVEIEVDETKFQGPPLPKREISKADGD